MRRLLTLLLLLPVWAVAQSSLPGCPSDKNSRWDRCAGAYAFGDGRVYVGEWENNSPKGWGIEYFSNGTVARSGRWHQDSLRGGERALVEVRLLNPAHYPFPSGQLPSLATCPTAGSKHQCTGEAILTGGIIYRGEFTNDLPSGFGSMTWPHDGSTYIGFFKAGEFHGEGVSYLSNGVPWQSGTWMNGSLVSKHAVAGERFRFRASPSASLESQIETERKKRQELEEEFERRRLAEARGRDRPQASRPATQRAERRVALIIGNSTYKVSPLPNPSNDATDFDEALRRSGFQTTLVRNATLGQMREATRRFADQLPNSDVALIYFAGHGIEANRKNYMIPVNADLKFEYELADQGYDAGIWLEMLESIKSNNAERVNIVILDACRNNTLIGSRNLGRGLGKMDAPTGTFLAYSTAPGRVAADGARGERNSPFTKHLLRAMQQPGLPIEEVFKEVRRNVSRETSGAQVPWESTSLTGFFTFSHPR